MKPVCIFNSAWRRTLVASFLVLPMLSACGRPGRSDVPVSIHAVNYSDQEFEYYLEDPENKSNTGGGESINRYAAGGIMCCYTLPKAWHPGLKVKIDYELYFPPTPDGKIRTTTASSLIDIPRYVDPQELWVVRDARGGMGILLSNFQPDHPKWPGETKGWPVPTLAYQRERAAIYIKTSEGYIKNLQELSDGMRNAPDETARRMWDLSEKYDHKEIAGYTGYQDKKYQTFLIEDLRASLAEEKENLKRLRRGAP